jgi:hypothetical protein
LRNEGAGRGANLRDQIPLHADRRIGSEVDIDGDRLACADRYRKVLRLADRRLDHRRHVRDGRIAELLIFGGRPRRDDGFEVEGMCDRVVLETLVR